MDNKRRQFLKSGLQSVGLVHLLQVTPPQPNTW